MDSINCIKSKIIVSFFTLSLVLFLGNSNAAFAQANNPDNDDVEQVQPGSNNNSQGHENGQGHNHGNGNGHHSHGNGNGYGHGPNHGGGNGHGGGNSMGAPLDGGLVSILLAGAGITYFTKRRKRNQE